MRAQTVSSFDRISIAYETRGDGDAVVLVHGWSCDRTYWEGQLDHFARAYRVVILDLAGHGESGRERSGWTISAFGEDVTAVVRELDPERVVLVGHSMGGDVILEAALRLPGRVAGLVWVDTYNKLPSCPSDEQIQSFMAPFRADFTPATQSLVRRMFPAGAAASLVERVADDMSSAPTAIALACLKSARAFGCQVPDLLRELGLPAIAINPDQPPTDIESMRQFGMETVLMPRVGHFPMLENPGEFNILLEAAVERFLR